jgi:CelD/BcsL family acetyltransferase involved in cellulose biosynthesis
MNYNILESSLGQLKDLRADSSHALNWFSPFVLPEWLQVWSQIFGSDARPYIRVVKQDDKVIGVAPLMMKNGTACFTGSVDVCDYQDFIIAPGKESEFFEGLLDYLEQNNVKQLDLKHVRPDSTVLNSLVPLVISRQYEVTNDKEAVSYEMDLPPSFEVYLESLSTKQRHEVRRKMRRLSEEGNIEYHIIDEGSEPLAALETFFQMFVESRQDKAEFLTDQMKSYFKALVDIMAGMGILKLGILELDKKPIASVMYFDYNNCIYLYNSGYDPKYVSLSAGLLSKVFAIKDSIEKGKKKFDFLKGAETYKGHLGGKEIPLYRCRINIV